MKTTAHLYKFILLVIFVFSAQSVLAITLTFEDFVPAGSSAYDGGTSNGFYFDNFGTIDGATYSEQTSGYAYGWIDESSVGYIPGSGSGSSVVNLSRVDGNLFDFNSVFLTSAWAAFQTVTITGMLEGAVVYPTQSFSISRYRPTFVDLDLLGVDLVRITGSNSQVVFENLTLDNVVVPVPASIWLFASSLLGLFGLKRSRGLE